MKYKIRSAAFFLAALGASAGTPLFGQTFPATGQSGGSSSITVTSTPTGTTAAGLTVNSTPPGAQVYLNDQYIGETPLLYTGFAAGTYKLRISEAGYYDNVRWVALDPSVATALDARMSPKVGYIVVAGAPAGARITIDRTPGTSGVNAVPTGPHTVTVQAFGYDDWSARVIAAEGRTTRVQPHFVKAAFRITNLTASRPVLRPLNPGPLGRTDLTFDVSTYGSARLTVTGPDASVVFWKSFPHFDRRRQQVTWNGRDGAGHPLPEGQYRVEITGGGDSAGQVSAAVTVTIDEASIITFRSLWSGASGLLYAETPETLPAGSFQISSLAAFGNAIGLGSAVPVQVGIRVAPLSGVEVDAQAAVLAEASGSLPYTAGIAGKAALIHPAEVDGFSLGVSATATYSIGITSDLMTNPVGFSAGVPMEYRRGPFGVVLTPEVTLSPSPTEGFTMWSYGRVGLFLDFGEIMTGASVALRSAPFTHGLAAAEIPAAGGWEIHWTLPDSQVVLSAVLGGEYSPSAGAAVVGGASIGILN